MLTPFAQYAVYVLYNRYHMEPRMARNPNLAPEARLEIGLMASIFIPVSLFMFGWASRASVHWLVTRALFYIATKLTHLCIQDCTYHCSRPLPAGDLPHLPVHHDVHLNFIPQSRRVCPRRQRLVQIFNGERVPTFRADILPETRPWRGLIAACWNFNRAHACILRQSSLSFCAGTRG